MHDEPASSASNFAGQKGQGTVMSAVRCVAVANLKVIEPHRVDLQLCALRIYGELVPVTKCSELHTAQKHLKGYTCS